MAVFKKSNYYSRIAQILLKYSKMADRAAANKRSSMSQMKRAVRASKSTNKVLSKNTLGLAANPLVTNRYFSHKYPLRTTMFKLSYDRISALLTLSAIYSLDNLLYSDNYRIYFGYAGCNGVGYKGHTLFPGFRGARLFSYSSQLTFDTSWDSANSKIFHNPWVHLKTSEYLETRAHTFLYVNPVGLNGCSKFVRVTDRQASLSHREFFKIFLYFIKPRTIYYEDMEEEYFKFHTRFKVFETNYISHWFNELWLSILSSLTSLTAGGSSDGFSFFWTLSTQEFNFNSNFILRLLVYEEIAWPFFLPFSVFKNSLYLFFLQNFPLYILFFVYRNTPEMWDDDDSIVKQQGDLKKLFDAPAGIGRFRKYVKYDYFVRFFTYPYKFFSQFPKHNYFIIVFVLLHYVNFCDSCLLHNNFINEAACSNLKLKFLRSTKPGVKRRKLLHLWKMNTNLSYYAASPNQQLNTNNPFEFFADRSVLDRTTRFPLDVDADILEEYNEEWFGGGYGEDDDEEEPVKQVMMETDNYYLSYFFDKTKTAYTKLFLIYEFFLLDLLNLSDLYPNSSNNKRVILKTLRRASRSFIYKTKRRGVLGFTRFFNRVFFFTRWYTLFSQLFLRDMRSYFSSNSLLKKYFSYNNAHRPLFLLMYLICEILARLYLFFYQLLGGRFALFFQFDLKIFKYFNYFGLLLFYKLSWLIIFLVTKWNSLIVFCLLQLKNVYRFFYKIYSICLIFFHILGAYGESSAVQVWLNDVKLFRLVRTRPRNKLFSSFSSLFSYLIFIITRALVSFRSFFSPTRSYKLFWNNFGGFLEYCRVVYLNIGWGEFVLNCKFWFFSFKYFFSEWFASSLHFIWHFRVVLINLGLVFGFTCLIFFAVKIFHLLFYIVFPLFLFTFFMLIYFLSSILRHSGFSDVRNMPVLSFFELARLSKNNSKWFFHYLKEVFFKFFKSFLTFIWNFFFIFNILLAQLYYFWKPLKLFWLLFLNSVFRYTLTDRAILISTYFKRLFFTANKFNVSKTFVVPVFHFIIFCFIDKFLSSEYKIFFRTLSTKAFWLKFNLIAWVWLYNDLSARTVGAYNWWNEGIIRLRYTNIDRKIFIFNNIFRAFFVNKLVTYAYTNRFNYVNMPLRLGVFKISSNLINFFVRHFVTFVEVISLRSRINFFEFFFISMEKFNILAGITPLRTIKAFFDDILVEFKFNTFIYNFTTLNMSYALFSNVTFGTFKKFESFFFRKQVRLPRFFFYTWTFFKIFFYSWTYFFISFFMVFKRLLLLFILFCSFMFLKDLLVFFLVAFDFWEILSNIWVSCISLNVDYLYLLFFIYFIFKIFLILFFIKKFS